MNNGIEVFLKINVIMLWLIILTATTGIFVNIIRRRIQKLRNISNNILLTRQLLLLTAAFWVLPFMFGYWWIREGDSIFTYEIFYSNSKAVLLIPAVIACWFIGFTVQILRYVRQCRLLCCIRLNSSRDHKIEARTCELSKRRLRVYRSNLVRSPMTMGAIHPSIFIPNGYICPDMLELILIHEITHIKHKDAVVKYFLMMITSINWFSSSARQLFYDINAYNEFYCDIDSINQLGIGADEYFAMIRRFRAENERNNLSCASTLYKNMNTLKVRSQICSRYFDARKNGSGCLSRSLLTLFTAIIVSAGLVFASTHAEVAAYDRLMKLTTNYKHEQTDISGEKSASESVVYSGKQLNLNAAEKGISEHRTWTIGENQEFRSGSYYLEKGESIWIYTSSDYEVEFGIVRDTDRYCVTGRNEGHNFTADEDGFYYAYIKNLADSKTRGQSMVIK